MQTLANTHTHTHMLGSRGLSAQASVKAELSDPASFSTSWFYHCALSLFSSTSLSPTHTPTHSKKHTNTYANTHSETHAHTLGAASIQASYPLACIVFELKSYISFSGTRVSLGIDKVLILHVSLDVFTATAAATSTQRFALGQLPRLHRGSHRLTSFAKWGSVVYTCAFLFTLMCVFVCLFMLKVSFPSASMDVRWEHAGVIVHTNM